MLENIAAVNFRNYSRLNLNFKSGIHALIGNNGHGKTNILEAIYFLSLLRSFRCNHLRNLIKEDNNSFHVSGHVQYVHNSARLDVSFGYVRRLSVNRVNVPKASEFIGRLHCVAFVPEDINLIQGIGGIRRRFLDIILSQVHPLYLSSLQQYSQALKSRNKLLKQDSVDSKTLKAFDTVLTTSGALVTLYRYQFCRALNTVINSISPSMLAPNDKITLHYHFSYSHQSPEGAQNDYEAEFRHALEVNFPKDIQHRFTVSGPHRDDFCMLFNGKSLSGYGSEGQRRIAVLILKMAAGKWLRNETDEGNVIFLLDDVLGELDNNRRRSLLEALNDVSQVFLTTTDESIVDEVKPSVVFRVVNGTVEVGNKRSSF